MFSKHVNHDIKVYFVSIPDGSFYLMCFLLDLYCTLEVDSYGYFVSKAKTRVFRDTAEPQWNEVSYQDISW